jgi:hypothetical protein
MLIFIIAFLPASLTFIAPLSYSRTGKKVAQKIAEKIAKKSRKKSRKNRGKIAEKIAGKIVSILWHCHSRVVN